MASTYAQAPWLFMGRKQDSMFISKAVEFFSSAASDQPTCLITCSCAWCQGIWNSATKMYQGHGVIIVTGPYHSYYHPICLYSWLHVVKVKTSTHRE